MTFTPTERGSVADALATVSPTTGKTFAETEAELRRVYKVGAQHLVGPGLAPSRYEHPWWR